MAPFDEIPAYPDGDLMSADRRADEVDNLKPTQPMAYAETVLAHEHARLVHENKCLRVMFENQRLAQENMMLLQLQSQSVPPPMYSWSPPTVGWPIPPPPYPPVLGGSFVKPPGVTVSPPQTFHQRHQKTNEYLNGTFDETTKMSSVASIARNAVTSRHNGEETKPACLTTVMLRNIPIDYTRALIVELLIARGYDGKFNLVYMPMDFQNRVGLGYAFINFVATESAEAFSQEFSGFSDWAIASDRVCEVRWSDVQGLEAHFERYRNSPVMHESVPDEYQPAIFTGSERVPFPPPTKLIRAPRHWNRAK